MAVSGNYFFNQVGQYAPMAQGVPYQPVYGNEGITGGLTGLPGMAFQMFAAQPMMNMMQQRTGFMPMGMHGQNMFDTMQQMRFTRMHDEVLRQAAETDRRTYMETFRGVAALSGTPWGSEQRQAARRLTDMGVAMTPMLAQTMPNLLDAMSGMRGSAAVLASQVHLGSRYQLDPVTGRMGYSVNTASGLANQIYKDMFEDPAAFSQMRGLSAGQVGGMYSELVKRGMVRTPTGTLDQRTITALQSRGANTQLINQIAVEQGMPMRQDAAMIDFQNLSSEQLSSLRADPRIQQQLRNVNAQQIKTTINSYKDAIAAVRDIFGSMGRPNAPMSELIAGLEAMTGGNLAQIDPGRLNMMVRTTHSLAQQTGIGLDRAMGMQQHAAMLAQQMGLDPIAAISATQGAMAYGGAYRAMGRGSYTAWGRLNAEELSQLDLNMRIGASNSAAANQGAVAMRIRDTLKGGFAKGSMAEAYTQALQSGADQFTFGGKTFDTHDIGDQQFQEMLIQGGRGSVNSPMLYSMLQDRHANQEFANKYNLGSSIRRSQHIHMKRWASDRLYEQLKIQLEAEGVDPAEAHRIASTAAPSMTEKMINAGPAVQTDRRKLQQLMAGEIRAVAGPDSAITENDALAMSETAYGWLNSSIRSGKYRAQKSVQGLFQTLDPAVREEAARQEASAQATAMMQSAMTGIGRGGLLRRGMEAVRTAKPGDSLMKTFARAVMIDPKDVSKAMRSNVAVVNEKRREYERKQAELANAKTPQERQRIMSELGTMQKSLQDSVNQLQETAISEGFYLSDTINADDLASAGENLDLLSKYGESIDTAATDQQWNKFWKSTEGAEFRRASRLAGADALDIADRLLGEGAAVKRLGKSGLERVEKFGRRQSRLQELAERHAGGDVARLLAGDYVGKLDDNQRKEIQQDVARITDLNKQDYKFFEGVLSGKQKGVAMSDEEAADLRSRATAVQKKLGLGGTDELISSAYKTFGMAESWSEMRHTQQADQMRQMLASGPAKQMLAEVISTRKTAQEIAKDQGFSADEAGWKAFTDKYEKAREDKSRMGLSKEEWDRLDYAMQTQKRTGFLRLGKRGLYRPEDMPELFASLAGETGGRGDSEQDPQGFPDTIRIEGHLSTDGKVEATGELEDVNPEN